MNSSIKRTLLWVALGIFTFLYVSPLQAQVVRDHRTKKTDDKVRDHRTETNTKVRDHRTKNTAITDGTSNILLLGENNTFVGTRTAILEKYPSFEFTGKVNRIMITDKLQDGDNSIYEMKSGNTLHAIVKKGKIIKYSWKDSQGNQISGGPRGDDLSGGRGDDILNGDHGNDDLSGDSFVASDAGPTCYLCTKTCHYPADGGGEYCFFECYPVDCSEPHNAELPGQVVKPPKPKE